MAGEPLVATIIRHDSANDSSAAGAVRPVAFSFGDLADRADDYLAEVRVEAAKIIQQAKAEAERIRIQAEAEGSHAAEQAASRVLDEKVAQQMSYLLPALESAVAQLVDARGAWMDYWQNAAVQLAASMAERLVRQKLVLHPEVTVEWIREALELAAGTADVVFLLHPADIVTLGAEIDRVTATVSSLTSARVVADDTVARGECVVQTRYGRIDQQIRSQLDRLIAELS
jgi:flagellar assembly protein FliH